MKKICWTAVLLANVILTQAGISSTEGELKEQLGLLEEVSQHVQIWHRAKFEELQKVSQQLYDETVKLDDSIEIKPDSYNDLVTQYVVDFYYAQSFIKTRIWTRYHGDPQYKFTEIDRYARIYEIAEQIGQQKGIIDEESGKLSFSPRKLAAMVLNKITASLEDFQKYNLPDDLDGNISEVKNTLFGLLGQAAVRGDRFDVFKESIPVFRKLLDLIAEMNEIAPQLEKMPESMKIITPEEIVLLLQESFDSYVEDIAGIEAEVYADE